jgi:hypothetical protein
VQFFSSAEEMRGQLISDLGTLLDRRRAATALAVPRPAAHEPAGPLPPAPFQARPYTLVPAADVVGRDHEITALERWLTDPASGLRAYRVLVMTAIGGMGESALAWKFFHDVAPAARGVAGRLWWSFYDQDSGFDTFVLRALAYVTERPLAEIRSLPLPASSPLHPHLATARRSAPPHPPWMVWRPHRGCGRPLRAYRRPGYR